MGLEGFPGDCVPGTAAWASHAERFLISEEGIRIGSHGRGEEIEHPSLTATAGEAIGALFEQREFKILVESEYGFLIEAGEPVEVAVRLCGNHHEILDRIAEDTDRTLLAPAIIRLGSTEDIQALEVYNAQPRLFARCRCLGVEQIFARTTDLFGVNAAGDGTRRVHRGHKNIHGGFLEMHRPCECFLEWNGCRVECDSREGIPEPLFLGFRVADSAIHFVQTKVRIERSEVGACDQRVFSANKIGSDLERAVGWFHLRIQLRPVLLPAVLASAARRGG